MMKRQTRKPRYARTPSQTSSVPTVIHRNTGEKLNTGERITDRFHSKDKITFGTWNVETLWRDGRLDELCHELKHYKWNVIGLSEARRKARWS